ncbi:MAG TPA: FtsX-like permease family protein, partial [Polyangiaceae bacterium]|nr:FtsX-like permease family protein [Polyangiaceae bacterium]
VPVRESLAPNSSWVRPFGTSMLDRALASVRGLSRVLLLAIRNTGRDRRRVALTLVMLAVGGVFFMSALNLRQSMVSEINRIYETSERADISIGLASDYPIDAVERAARRVPGVSTAEGWTVVKGNTAPLSTESGRTYAAKEDEIKVVGVPPESRLIALDISNGRNLAGGPREVVVNTGLFGKLGNPAIGSEVSFRVEGKDASFHLAGVASAAFTPPTAYVSRSFFDERSKAGTVNSLRVALAPSTSTSLEGAKADVEANLDRDGIRIEQASTKAESRYAFDAHMLMIYVLLIAISCILGCVGTLGLVTTISLNVNERRRELGVLRAIGATPARVAQIVILEGMVVGAVAWLIAMAVVMPLGKIIGDLMLRWMLRAQSEIPIAIEPKGIVIWLAVALIGSALASFWPARQASRKSVREALTYE